MSALALAYAAATNPSHKEILRRNITRMVNELRECQERTFVWSEKLGRYLEARDFCMCRTCSPLLRSASWTPAPYPLFLWEVGRRS